MTAKKKKDNPGKGDVLEATMLFEIFKKSMESNTTLTTKMDTVCHELRKNTEVSNKLLNHFSNIPSALGKIKQTLDLLKWGFLPVIVSLIGLILFFALR